VVDIADKKVHRDFDRFYCRDHPGAVIGCPPVRVDHEVSGNAAQAQGKPPPVHDEAVAAGYRWRQVATQYGLSIGAPR